MIDQASIRSASDSAQKSIKVVRRRASILRFFRDPVAFFRSLCAHDGSVTELSLGKRRFYVLSDPAIIRDVLTTRGASFEKFPQGNPKQQLFGDGLLTSEGAAQKRQRRILLPGFHRDRLQIYARQIAACVERLEARWIDNVDVAREMNDLTLEIIGRTLLGVNEPRLMKEIGEHLHTMLNLVSRFVVPWGDWLMKMPLPSSIGYRRAAASLDLIIYRLIAEARRDESPGNLIGILIAGMQADGRALTDTEIRDEIVTMIVAGHETVAVGLTWSLFLLASHPELQDEFAARTRDVLQNRAPEAEDYPRLEFLQHAFAEAMRLYPPIWILGRRSLDQYAFGNFNAPKGSIFLVCMADLHRRASFFPDPDLFKPERWANPDWSAYAYIPFGGGERRCIGERFAWMEAVLVLACLLRWWRFSLIPAQAPVATAKLTLHPGGPVWLRITSRELAT